MKMTQWISMSGLAGIIAVFSVGACHGTDSGSGDDPTNATFQPVVAGPEDADWSQNSVRICGVRGTFQNVVAADDKYGCDSTLPLDENGDPCQCYNFDAAGQVLDGNDPLKLTHLCASEDYPHALWRFRYEIYSEQNCGGDRINGNGDNNPNNFICYDVQDLNTQDHPNASVEELHPGLNENEIFCIAQTAKKTWDFTTCDVNSDDWWMPGDVGPTTYDCGCSLVAGDCSCDGIGPVELPDGCAFNTADGSCDITCQNP